MLPNELIPAAILVAIAPGYLLLWAASRGRTRRELKPDLHLVVQSLALSAIVLLITAPVVVPVFQALAGNMTGNAIAIALYSAGAFIAVPLALGFGLRLAEFTLGTRTRIGRWLMLTLAPPPTLWDWAASTDLFADRFVLVEYDDGRLIAGAHGSPGVTLTSPEPPAIYLAVEWDVATDGYLTRPRAGSAGVLIPITEQVRAIHLYNPGGEPMKSKVATAEEQKGIKPATRPPPDTAPARHAPTPAPKEDHQ